MINVLKLINIWKPIVPKTVLGSKLGTIVPLVFEGIPGCRLLPFVALLAALSISEIRDPLTQKMTHDLAAPDEVLHFQGGKG